jgi:hypothetical protein
MGSVAIKPPNTSSHVTGDTTLVFLPKSSCLRDLSSGTASFKGFYCRNPGTRLPKIYSVKRKGSIKGFIVVGRTSRAMPLSLHAAMPIEPWYPVPQTADFQEVAVSWNQSRSSH